MIEWYQKKKFKWKRSYKLHAKAETNDHRIVKDHNTKTLKISSKYTAKKKLLINQKWISYNTKINTSSSIIKAFSINKRKDWKLPWRCRRTKSSSSRKIYILKEAKKSEEHTINILKVQNWMGKRVNLKKRQFRSSIVL